MHTFGPSDWHQCFQTNGQVKREGRALGQKLRLMQLRAVLDNLLQMTRCSWATDFQEFKGVSIGRLMRYVGPVAHMSTVMDIQMDSICLQHMQSMSPQAPIASLTSCHTSIIESAHATGTELLTATSAESSSTRHALEAWPAGPDRDARAAQPQLTGKKWDVSKRRVHIGAFNNAWSACHCMQACLRKLGCCICHRQRCRSFACLQPSPMPIKRLSSSIHAKAQGYQSRGFCRVAAGATRMSELRKCSARNWSCYSPLLNSEATLPAQ